MIAPDFQEEAPNSDKVEPYDERHLVDYLRLLDADAEGSDWQEAARLILQIDPVEQPARAKAMHETHLARARWMSRVGYRQLAERGHEKPPMS
jgi:hypothetical protein